MNAVEFARQITKKEMINKPYLREIKQPRTADLVLVERREDRKLEKKAVSTGWIGLDEVIKGFIPGRLYTMTGDTNVGKTAVAANFTHNVASQGGSVLYFALEPDRQLVDYLISAGHQKAFSFIENSDEVLHSQNIHIFGADDIHGIGELVDSVERLDRFDLVVVDHIGYFVSSGNNNYYAAQGDVLKQLALLAQRKQTAILLIAHLNKTAQITPTNWVPNMNQISGTAAFKQDSDDVLIIARRPTESTVSEGIFSYTEEGCIYVNKTKAGKNGIVPVKFIDGTAWVREVRPVISAPREAYDF